MNHRITEIKEEMNELKAKLHLLEKELTSIQSRCEHQYMSNHYMRKCTKCERSESLYY